MLNQSAVEISGGMLSRSMGMPSRREGVPSIWDTHGISGNVFANPVASSSAPDPQQLNAWSAGTEEPLTDPQWKKVRDKHKIKIRDASLGQSAKNSVIFSGGDSSKNYGTDQQRLQFLDLHFDKFPTPATFACWKIRFKTEVCTCSQFPTEAMHWIKEVELADSVDELRSSSSIRSIPKQNHPEIPASRKRSVWRNRKPKKEDPFLRGRQIAYLIYDYFRVTGSQRFC